MAATAYRGLIHRRPQPDAVPVMAKHHRTVLHEEW